MKKDPRIPVLVFSFLCCIGMAFGLYWTVWTAAFLFTLFWLLSIVRIYIRLLPEIAMDEARARRLRARAAQVQARAARPVPAHPVLPPLKPVPAISAEQAAKLYDKTHPSKSPAAAERKPKPVAPSTQGLEFAYE